MWKSLRIGALLALAALGGLKLAQHAAAQSQMQRLVQVLAPLVRISYSDVSGALDGRVILESPRLEVLTGPARGAVIRANRASIEPAGTFWLLQRVLSGDVGVPSGLDVRLKGATFSEETLDRYAREGWFGPVSLVPFESVGCEPVTAFSARDYARMDLALRPREDDLRYVYDAAGHTFRADIVSTAAPFSTMSAHLELSSFEPSSWFGEARASKAQRIEQFSLTYLDGGYLAKRNRFCAQLTGTDAAGYATRHLAAVKAFLDVRGITPGDEVSALYRKLVTDGGSAELSSLPEAAFVPADFASYAPEDLLRQLNVTLRRNTAPPILMRLRFAERSPESPDLAGSGDSVAAETVATSVAELAEQTEPTLDASTTVAVPPEPTKSEGMPLLSVANAAAIPLETPRISLPEPPSEIIAVATTPSVMSALRAIDHPEVDPRNAIEAIPASAPPPPPNSTAALVWRAPTIERLPQRPGPLSNYVSIPTAALGAHLGARVRLLTAGGKLVEGRLQNMEGTDAVVLILRDGGSAQMRIPQSGIRDVQIRRATSP